MKTTAASNKNPYPDLNHSHPMRQALINGFRGKCPNCGKGVLYNGFINIKEKCGFCNEKLFHHCADDLPAYLNIFLVGHIIMVLLTLFMKYEFFGVWLTAVIFLILTIVMSIALMRPIKGMIVGFQWAMRMHGFGKNSSYGKN